MISDFGTDHYYAADGTFSHTAAPWASLGEALADPNGIRKQYRDAKEASAVRMRSGGNAEANWHADKGNHNGSSDENERRLDRAAPAAVVAVPNSTVDQHAFEHSKAAYAGMARTDPDAIWVQCVPLLALYYYDVLLAQYYYNVLL
jgi:hypothetical protein